MITVITGTPGAGKTLYAITKLIQPLVGTSVPHEGEDGVTTMHPRTVYTNINGLLLDHELIDGGDNQGLRDWWTWAKPGSVIVFDEVQRIWQPRANGSKVPEDIQMLETHRHLGVDFILITQNVMLLDRNIQALGGRHLHVRRIANAALAIVYEWDHVSRQLLYAKSLTKTAWRYDKKIFKLYKSAEVHTKQPRSLPGVIWFMLLGLAAAAWLGPAAYGRLQERTGGKPAHVSQNHQAKPQPAATAAPLASTTATPAQLVATLPPKPKLLGCIESKNRCSCFDEGGDLVEMEPKACKEETHTLKRLAAGQSTYTPGLPPPMPPAPVAAAPAPLSNGSSGWVDSKPQARHSLADVNAEFSAHRPRL